MTLQTLVTIYCDGCEVTKVAHTASFEDIRNRLADDKWVYVASLKKGGHGMDYCPSCVTTKIKGTSDDCTI